MTEPVTATILGFITAIGLPVHRRPVIDAGAVPGISLDHGGLVVDPEDGFFPGDLLHEAGHLALLPPSVRATATGRLEVTGGYELGAICWSVAAAWHLELDLDLVFHEDGYRGEGGHLVQVFRSGAAPGLPMLEWAGLTWAPGHEPEGEHPFPAMRAWLRTTEIPVGA